MDETTPVEPKPQNTGKTALLIILGLFLAGSLFSNYWLWDKQQKATTLANGTVDSLKKSNSTKDSLYLALAEEEQKVIGLRTEISLYQTENDSLKTVLEEKLAKIASLRAMIAGGGSPSKLRALKDSISKMSAENTEFRTKVQGLLMENETYRQQLAEREGQISSLEDQKKVLADKVDIAAQPSVGPIIVTPMYQKKGTYIPIYKAKKVERLQITFEVMGNKLTSKTVEKEYTVRIINPDGIVLSNSNQKLSNSDDVYTVKQSVSFNGTSEKIKINFNQSSSYKKGKYKVELKDGDEVKQTFSFDLQ